MPKVGRAGTARSAKPRKPAASRRKAKAVSPRGAKLSNWMAARLRAARYRAGYALRLAVLGVGGLCVLSLAGLMALGRMDEIGAALNEGLDARLARSGFAVRAVDVTGASRLDGAAIAEAMGVDPGHSLLAIDPAAARARIEAMSWVEEAQVARLWPDRVHVILKEREPFAVWQHNGAHHVIDRSGTVIAAAEATQYGALPRVVGEGANAEAAPLLDLLARQEAIDALVTHAVRVGERRWNLRLLAGGDILLPEGDPASALALIATLHDERGVLNLDAQAFDLRTQGELVIRAWPDRAAAARGRGA
ncbi:cell division protein FtsQ/DivIB [Marinicauda sp. Alg238-R41]|uniref:cell division protein FtsQ/DivIB n=1 Tax=Marinicauda sp. Alg238-R41 TaxID=2993447 RepID=UPI0022E4EF86|nr:FtsQ-type POTRA domain-containing protein [Marinicauda sp. Alg238-R41]